MWTSLILYQLNKQNFRPIQLGSICLAVEKFSQFAVGIPHFKGKKVEKENMVFTKIIPFIHIVSKTVFFSVVQHMIIWLTLSQMTHFRLFPTQISILDKLLFCRLQML